MKTIRIILMIFFGINSAFAAEDKVNGNDKNGNNGNHTGQGKKDPAPKKDANLEADPVALAKLNAWRDKLAKYPKSGPSRSQELALHEFNTWGRKNATTIKARAQAKGWMYKQVQPYSVTVKSPETRIRFTEATNRLFSQSLDRNICGTVDRARLNTPRGKNPSIMELAYQIDHAYQDAQVLIYLYGDADDIGAIKKCNE